MILSEEQWKNIREHIETCDSLVLFVFADFPDGRRHIYLTKGTVTNDDKLAAVSNLVRNDKELIKFFFEEIHKQISGEESFPNKVTIQ